MRSPLPAAVHDRPAAILIDQALEYGDTTATLTAAGQGVRGPAGEIGVPIPGKVLEP